MWKLAELLPELEKESEYRMASPFTEFDDLVLARIESKSRTGPTEMLYECQTLRSIRGVPPANRFSIQVNFIETTECWPLAEGDTVLVPLSRAASRERNVRTACTDPFRINPESGSPPGSRSPTRTLIQGQAGR
jgi:hypothetical protein